MNTGPASGLQAQQIKVLAVQTWQPEFKPQRSHKRERKKLTPPSCPVSTRASWHMHTLT